MFAITNISRSISCGAITGEDAMKTKQERPWTMSIPAAGAKYFGLSVSGAYAAADRGEIPTIRVGRLRKALVAPLEKMLTEEPAK